MATGTTPNGTAWTSFNTTQSGEQIRWGVANAHAFDSDIPTILYCHGSSGAANQFEALGAWAGLRNWVIDNGWAWIEGTGGSPQNWGGPAARAGYGAQFAHVSGVLDIGPVVILGRSMGGLVAYWLATQSMFADQVVGLIVNSGTTDLAYRYAKGNETSRQWIRSAYEAANDAEFTANSVGYDPMLFDESVWAGKAVLQMYGTADTTVEAQHHAIPWVEKYAATDDHLSWFGFDVRNGGDHSESNGSYLQVAAMTEFLTHAAAGSWPAWEPVDPAPPRPRTLRRVRASYRLIGARRHTIRPRPPRAA